MKNVVILAAGNILNKLSSIKAYNSSPALIPLNTKPLIIYHLDYYKSRDCRVHIVVNPQDSAQIKTSINLSDYPHSIIEVPTTNGVNESLKQALQQIVPTSQTIVNLVTSIPTRFPEDDTILLEKIQSYNNDWSCISFDDQNPKYLFKSSAVKSQGHAFTGIFSMRTEHLLRSVSQFTDHSDLLDVICISKSNERSADSGIRFEFDDWIDAGHEINYYQARLKLMSCRSFNSLSVDDFGILKKQSSNVEKLRDEAEFIQSLPSPYSILFPRVLRGFSYHDNGTAGSYCLEFYGYPNLAELMLFWDLKDEVWTRIFNDLCKVIQLFLKDRGHFSKQAYESFYQNKIEERVRLFTDTLGDDHQFLISKELYINGEKYGNYQLIKDRLFKRIADLYSADDFCIVHGDLCFNNILYDVPHRLVKLIDPRGCFGPEHRGIYGDLKYDLAKLLHSAMGGYDFLVNNLYRLDFEGYSINYEIYYKHNREIIERNARQLIIKLGYSIKDIMLIVGTLFLTMPPLHTDSFARQKVFYLHGIKIINENL